MSENKEQSLEQNIKNKEYEQILQTLDNKEGRDLFMKKLSESKDHITEIFWRDIFKEQFRENGDKIIDSLLAFSKNIDKNEFNSLDLQGQLKIIGTYINSNLQELDLYREMGLINTYLNYDLYKTETIKIEDILAGSSEKQLNQNELYKSAQLSRFAYADLEKDNSRKYEVKNSNSQIESEILGLIDKKTNNLGKGLNENSLSFRQKTLLTWIENSKNKDFGNKGDIDFQLNDGNIIITDERISPDIKNKFQNIQLAQIVGKSSLLANINVKNLVSDVGESIESQALKISIQESTLFNVLRFLVFSDFKGNDNTENYKKDLEDIQKDYTILKQVNDPQTGFGATILEEKNQNKSKDLIISLRGSDEIIDWVFSNLQIGLGEIGINKFTPAQIQSLQELMAYLKHNYPGRKIKIVGHSLGGFLSEIADNLGNRLEITENCNFNGPGTKNISGINYSENSGNNAIKTKNSDTIGNIGEQTARYTIPIAGKGHSINNVMSGIIETQSNPEKTIPILDRKSLRPII